MRECKQKNWGGSGTTTGVLHKLAQTISCAGQVRMMPQLKSELYSNISKTRALLDSTAGKKTSARVFAFLLDAPKLGLSEANRGAQYMWEASTQSLSMTMLRKQITVWVTLFLLAMLFASWTDSSCTVQYDPLPSNIWFHIYTAEIWGVNLLNPFCNDLQQQGNSRLCHKYIGIQQYTHVLLLTKFRNKHLTWHLMQNPRSDRCICASCINPLAANPHQPNHVLCIHLSPTCISKTLQIQTHTRTYSYTAQHAFILQAKRTQAATM